MPNRSRAQRSSKQKKAYLRRMAKETGKSVKDIQALEDALRQLPIERWLENFSVPIMAPFMTRAQISGSSQTQNIQDQVLASLPFAEIVAGSVAWSRRRCSNECYGD